MKFSDTRKDGIEAFAAKLEVPEGVSDTQVFDDTLPGFGIRKFSTGVASFFVKYNVGKQQRRKTLGRVVNGSLADMRKEASAILAKAHLGTDVVADANAAAEKANLPTLGSLVVTYLAARKGEVRGKTFTEMTRYLTVHWAPLHGRQIEAIRRPEIVAVLDTIQGKVAADRARTALSGLFSWAIERGHVEQSPVSNIKSRDTNGGRARVLDEAELSLVWRACADDDHGRIVRLLILSGQRRA